MPAFEHDSQRAVSVHIVIDEKEADHDSAPLCYLATNDSPSRPRAQIARLTARRRPAMVSRSEASLSASGRADVPRKGARLLAAAARHDEAWLGAAAFVFFLFLLSLGDHLLDADAYYHIRIADLLRTRGWVGALPWMAASIHAERFVDFHFLFHWLQVPFVVVTPDLLSAARLSAAVFAALGVWAFVTLLRAAGTAHRWFWALFLALASPIYTGRWLFGRGGALFTALLFLFLASLVAGRPRLTAC